MPKRILVIDDAGEILELFTDLLTSEGYIVITRASAVKEVEDIRLVQPDLIILDYLIDGEAVGWQTLQKLKLASIPVIICTAAINKIKEVEGQLARMEIGFVAKPFDIDSLLAEVEKRIGKADAPVIKSSRMDGQYDTRSATHLSANGQSECPPYIIFAAEAMR